MTPTQATAKIEEILGAHKLPKSVNQSELVADLLGLIKVTKEKVSKQAESFPPRYNDEGVITHIYCLWHKEYEAVELFANSPRSKTGFHYECKIAGKHWTAYGKAIKIHDEEIQRISEAVLNGVITPEQGRIDTDLELAERAKLMDLRLSKTDFEGLVIEPKEDTGTPEDQEESTEITEEA